MTKNETLTVPVPADKQQYPLIDLFKFVLVFFVVAVHVQPLPSFYARYPFTEAINYFITNYLGRITVPFYFAVAGFLLFRKIDIGHFDPSVTREYMFRNLRLYAIWIILLIFGYTYQMWYMSALVIAVCLLTLLLNKGASKRTLIITASVLYVIGLLGDSYFKLVEPLQNVTILNYAIQGYYRVFQTTRNGLFMGFPFLLLGGLIQKRKAAVRPLYALIGFILSMALLFGEAFLLRKWGLPKGPNMYVLQIPAVAFLLMLATGVSVKPRSIYKTLRNVGVLIYFLHLFVYQLIGYGNRLLDKLFGFDLDHSLVNYLLTILISAALGFLIDRLSKKKKWQFLKYLYS